MGKDRLHFDYKKYRVPEGGAFHLKKIRPDDTQGITDKKAARAALERNRERIAALQERLYAENRQALLIVLQAMDTGGKDSTIRSVMTGINPQGCRIYGFKKPTPVELSHDFLWRVHQRVPPAGHIGIFNRSHYEDVLIVRVHGWAPKKLIEKRYEHINNFERLLHDHGTRVIKIYLHISKEYQLGRFRRRLERPDKWWKFNPADLEERKYWDEYMRAYEIALNRCSKKHAPWYVVPAEKRWFRNLVISRILLDTLEAMDPQYPKPSFDPSEFPPERLV
ncbi:polyphosphate kinase 2 family protein [Rhodocaloribacter sp.]